MPVGRPVGTGFAGALSGVSPGVLLGTHKPGQAALGRVSTHLEVRSQRSSSKAPPAPWFFMCKVLLTVLFTFHFHFQTPLAGHCLAQFKMSLKALLVY